MVEARYFLRSNVKDKTSFDKLIGAIQNTSTHKKTNKGIIVDTHTMFNVAAQLNILSPAARMNAGQSINEYPLTIMLNDE